MKEATKALRGAEKRQQAAAQTVAGKSEQLATLLDHALSLHKAHGDGPCPVCGREKALDSDWHQAKAKEAADLRQTAKEATEARKGLDAAQARLQELTKVDWPLVRRAEEAGPCHPEGSAIAESVSPLSVALEQLRQAAVVALTTREDTWRPQALFLLEWLPKAISARRSAATLPSSGRRRSG